MTLIKTGVESIYSQNFLRDFDRYGERQTEAATHCLRVTKDGNKLLFTLRIEAERLAEKLKDTFQVVWIKTNNTIWKGTAK